MADRPLDASTRLAGSRVVSGGHCLDPQQVSTGTTRTTYCQGSPGGSGPLGSSAETRVATTCLPEKSYSSGRDDLVSPPFLRNFNYVRFHLKVTEKIMNTSIRPLLIAGVSLVGAGIIAAAVPMSRVPAIETAAQPAIQLVEVSYPLAPSPVHRHHCAAIGLPHQRGTCGDRGGAPHARNTADNTQMPHLTHPLH